MKKIGSILLGVSILAVCVIPTFASVREEVLGVKPQSVPEIPPTTEGPGLLLPDSPLFFLDQFKQKIRVLFSATPEIKAKTYAAIAGERMAELRFMLAKNNKSGIATDLQGISENLQHAADSVKEAKLTGRDVKKLAIDITTLIKEKQNALDVLVASADTRALRLQTQATQQEVLQAKITVEDALPYDEQQKEIVNDLQRAANQEMTDASVSAHRLAGQLAVLGIQASASAKQSARQAKPGVFITGGPEKPDSK